MTSGSKQYGLLLPQKGGTAKSSTVVRPNVFGDDSDSETEDRGDWVKNAFKREVGKSIQKHSIKTQVKKALEQDPTVFQYDEIYEELEHGKADLKAAKKGVEKKPRYIQALLQTAERRKKENERRIERQVQKEREEEGTQFADKESFVTASYRAKLEEFKKQEEEEKRMERLEAIADVTKQKDLTGFYRHLYRQTVGDSLQSDKSEDKDNNIVGGSELDSLEKTNDEPSLVQKEFKKDRQYRKRHSSSSSSSSVLSGKETTNLGSKNKKNIDADSNLSSSSSSSSTSDSESSGMESGSEEGEIKKKKKENTPVESVTPSKRPKLDDETKVQLDVCDTKNKESMQDINSKDTDAKGQIDMTESVNKTPPSSEVPKQEEDTKPKICIWTKRTVGQAYEDALKRYFERKAARTAGRA